MSKLRKPKSERKIAYRTKFTAEEREERRAALMEKSQVYRWLKEDYKVSSQTLMEELKIPFHKIHEVFFYPHDELRLRQLYAVAKMLPDKSIYEILKGLDVEFDKPWFEMDEGEEREVVDYYERYIKGK